MELSLFWVLVTDLEVLIMLIVYVIERDDERLGKIYSEKPRRLQLRYKIYIAIAKYG